MIVALFPGLGRMNDTAYHLNEKSLSKSIIATIITVKNLLVNLVAEASALEDPNLMSERRISKYTRMNWWSWF
jgi:hypothetical protein